MVNYHDFDGDDDEILIGRCACGQAELWSTRRRMQQQQQPGSWTPYYVYDGGGERRSVVSVSRCPEWDMIIDRVWENRAGRARLAAAARQVMFDMGLPFDGWLLKDVVQDTFCRALKKAHDRHADAVDFVIGFLCNVTMEHCRDTYKRRWTPLHDDGDLAQDLLADDGRDVAAVLSTQEAVQQLEAMLPELPKLQADVLRNVIVLRRSVDETAAALGKTRDAVSGALKRGRDTVKRRLKRYAP
jgi:RNA polymerase sigma factor (sigma-70 family)